MDIFEKLDNAERIAADDVVSMRKVVFASGHISETHLRKLLSLTTEGEDCQEWQWLLNDACRDFFLEQGTPQLYFSDRAIATLDVFEQQNRTNPGATEALVHILDKCMTAPDEATKLAMKNLEADVLADGKVTDREAALLRRFLYSPGSENGLGISRAEADMLLTINGYSHEGQNDPAWTDLFCKAIGNHLMVQHGYIAPSREEALRREEWLADTSVSPVDFIGDMMTSMFKGFGKRDRECLYKKRKDAFDALTADAEMITDEEAQWLASRLGNAGSMCDTEKAMIAYVSELCDTDLPKILKPYQIAA